MQGSFRKQLRCYRRRSRRQSCNSNISRRTKHGISRTLTTLDKNWHLCIYLRSPASSVYLCRLSVFFFFLGHFNYHEFDTVPCDCSSYCYHLCFLSCLRSQARCKRTSISTIKDTIHRPCYRHVTEESQVLRGPEVIQKSQHFQYPA